MQYPPAGSSTTAVKIPAAWEYDLANGTYTVTVAVGDPAVGTDPESHVINVEDVRAINNFVPSGAAGSDTRHLIATITVNVSDGKLTLDAIGGTNTKIDYVDITGGPVTPVDLNVNFQSETATVPTNYLRDFGESYGLRTGANQGSGLSYGWVVPGSTTPLSLVGNGRDRNLISDQRLDTLVHMQGNDIPNFSGVKQPGAWEIAIPNGLYQVFVSVGDAGTAVDSSNCINIEGQPTIVNFVPTSSTHFSNATVTISVNDGRLTIDATGGINTKINYVTVTNADVTNRPSVTSSSPANNATGVLRDTAVTAEVHLPNTGFGIDPSTLTSQTVKLQRTSDNTQVPATLNTSGGGDVIVLDPSALLDSNTSYTFRVTEGLKDLSGAAFVPYTSSFTTGSSSSGTTNSPASFEKVTLPTASGSSFTSLAMGPDGKLYAGTIEGEIVCFPLNPDGTTGTPQVITSVQTANGGQRMLIGLAFDPASTATNLILWVSHSAYAFNSAPDWSGKITRLSGSNLTTVQDYVINLPRSIRDHMTNSIAFGPDGALYFTQGSNTSMGAPDDAWGLRPEHVLTAAVLRLNRSAVTSPPLNALTPDGGGTYNPFAAGAPLTIYASGTRNAFDLVWHSNGQLYVPTNGAAAGGNTPNTPTTLPTACQNRLDGVYTGPQVTGITNVTIAQSDYLFRVVQGGYYGNPNPQRCEWVLNGGNPTSAADPAQVSQYPVGTQPDRNWRRFAFDFGAHYSPDGAIEYRSNVFNGALRGKLLVVRYSAGDDIIVLTPGGSTLDIVAAETGITGFTDFQDPLDLVEDTRNGNLYVSEFAAQKITLLRPTSGASTYSVTPDRLIYNAVQNTTSAAQTATVSNTGSQSLTITGLSLTGTNPGQFQINSQPALPATIQPGSSATIAVVFKPTSAGPKKASLQIQTNNVVPQATVALRGLGTLGTGGSNEPSLQWILDTFDIPVNVGDPDPTDSSLPSTALLGDEVSLQRFQKASSAPVTIEPIAVFGPNAVDPTVRFGWYTSGNAASKQQMFTVSNVYAQNLNPQITGSTSFDPGVSSFGFYSVWPFFNNREVFSEDALNTFTGAIPHHVRVYPFKDLDGTVVSNAYVLAMEESTSNFDYQDVIAIIRNVKPLAGGPKINVVNLDGVPFSDRVVFNRIGGLASPPTNGVHDVATLRVENVGASQLQISNLQLTGSWVVLNAPSLPAAISSGGHLDLSLQFRATCCDVNNGTLTIVSNDSEQPNTAIQLSGFWQSVSEGGQEPNLMEQMTVFGYGTKIVRTGEQLNQSGLVVAVGDEILSPYWVRANQSNPVSVRQIASFHTYPNPAIVSWHNKGSNTLNSIFTTYGEDAQSVLPRRSASTHPPAAGTFTPSTNFGFKIDGEWSDDTKNNQTADENKGCPGPCGHHVRFWPVRDRQGKLVADTWLMAMDYSGINYDYNDNVYLISNIRPENSALNPTAASLYRLDVAGSSNYTDTYARSWTTDAGFFSPSTAIDEGANIQTQEIAKTDDDVIYRTYRGNVGNVPLSQRVLTYNLPTNGIQNVDLRLHFAERVWTSAGKRIFNIEAEGQVLRSNFDIFATAGAANTALVLPFSNINVVDGSLTLVFRTVVDYPSIAGIEVLCPSGCGNSGSGNISPTVSITSPANNSAFTAPANISINASTSDSDGTIDKVDFYANSAFIGSDSSSPYSFAWGNVGAGNYSLVAVATDNQGRSSTSAAVNVSVSSGGNAVPTVTITSPANNSTFNAPATITINANASDRDGTVAKVDFLNNGTLLGTDTTAAYSFVWNNVGGGNYSLTARATDNTGAATTSSPINITVVTVPPAAPSNLTTSTVSGSRIDLAWNDNSNNESGFKIEQSVNNVNFTQVATVAAGVRTYGAAGLTELTTYYFRVRAYNSAGNSNYSNTASATTELGGPTNLVANAVSSSQIDLSWNDSSNSETGFKIERSTNGSTFSQITTVGANMRSFHDSGLASRTRYYYRVRATNAGGDSDYSNIANTRTRR
jgi:hypothetical protein